MGELHPCRYIRSSIKCCVFIDCGVQIPSFVSWGPRIQPAEDNHSAEAGLFISYLRLFQRFRGNSTIRAPRAPQGLKWWHRIITAQLNTCFNEPISPIDMGGCLRGEASSTHMLLNQNLWHHLAFYTLILTHRLSSFHRCSHAEELHTLLSHSAAARLAVLWFCNNDWRLLLLHVFPSPNICCVRVCVCVSCALNNFRTNMATTKSRGLLWCFNDSKTGSGKSSLSVDFDLKVYTKWKWKRDDDKWFK